MGNRKVWTGILILFLFMLPGCEAIAKILATGVVIGIIIAILVIALIIWAIAKFVDL